MTEKSVTTRLKQRLMIRPPVDSDPRLFKSSKKAVIIVGIALCASASGFSSTIYFPGLPYITKELNAPSIATTLTAALFVLFMGIAPVFWASISDHFHIRRFVLICSMSIFAIAALGAVFVKNIWALVVLRCIQALGASCGQSVGAGVIADLYPIEQRGAAFAKFFFGVFFGPLLGPIIGGLLIMSSITWRATFWFCFAFACCVLIFLIVVFPETYRVSEKFDTKLPRTSQDTNSENSSPTVRSEESNEKIKSEHSDSDLKSNAPVKRRINPLGAFLLLRHPFIFIAALVSGIAFGCMFAVETIIPDLYEINYGFDSWKTGLSYLGAGVGNLCGSILGGMVSDKLLLRARAKRDGKAVVEDRLTFNLWIASGFVIFGLLLFGWSTAYKLTVWAPIIAFGIQTFGMNQITTATSAYLVDAMPGGAASSATAAANLVRNVMACVFTLATNPMVSAIGPGYTSVFLAGLSVLGLILMTLLKIYGAKLRRWSGYGDKE